MDVQGWAMGWRAVGLTAAAVAVLASAACGPKLAANEVGAGAAPLTVDPSAWPNPNAVPQGPVIDTGLVIGGRELILNYTRLTPDDQNIIEDAVWLDRQAGS